MYEYKCKILKIIDGDTVDVDIDLGFGIWLRNERIRINGIDTPESRTRDKVEKVFGLAAKERLTQLLSSDNIVLKTYSAKNGEDMKGKFGRILGDFEVFDIPNDCWTYVSNILVLEGHAVKYYGQNKAEIEVAHLANRNLLMENGTVDPKIVQEAELKNR